MRDEVRNLGHVINKIRKAEKEVQEYGTGLAHEKVIIASYRTMTIKQMESLRYILTQEIKRKKILRRINAKSKDRNSETTKAVK